MADLNKHLQQSRVLSDSYVREVRERCVAEFVTKPSADMLALANRILDPTQRDVVELAFKHGGFVAGGFARYLAKLLRGERSEVEAHVSSNAYFLADGDVDLFFRSKEDHNNFLNDLDENLRKHSNVHVRTSKGKLAVDVLVHALESRKWRVMQTIGCVYGQPNEVISTFDFFNCMIAFDANSVYASENFEQLEESNTLCVSWFGGASLPYRLRKYVKKYDYTSVTTFSNASTCLEQLLKNKDCSKNQNAVLNIVKVWQEVFGQDGVRWQPKIFDAVSGAVCETLMSNNEMASIWFATLRAEATTRQQTINAPRNYDMAFDIATNGYVWAVKPDDLEYLDNF